MERQLINSRDDTENENSQLNSACWKRKSILFLFLYLLVVISYLCIGAYCFSLLEKPLDMALRQEVFAMRKTFLSNHSCITENDLSNFMQLLENYNHKIGNDVFSNILLRENSRWNFVQSLFFCVTLITTVGYGTLAPVTDEGKIFCIFYILFGIPLTLVMFTAVTERVYWVLKWFRELLLHYLESERLSEFAIRLLHFLLYLFLVTSCFFLLPAVAFHNIEERWSYLEALYFCVVSLTTVGLGDYVPSDFQRNGLLLDLYRVTVIFYLFLGLTFVISLLRLADDLAELNPGRQLYPASHPIFLATNGGIDLATKVRRKRPVSVNGPSLSNRPSTTTEIIELNYSDREDELVVKDRSQERLPLSTEIASTTKQDYRTMH